MGRMRQMSAVVAGCVLLAGCTSNNSDQAQDDTGGQATAASQQQAGQEGQSGQDGVEGRPFPGRCVHADHIDTTPVTTAPRSRWMTVQDIRVPPHRGRPLPGRRIQAALLLPQPRRRRRRRREHRVAASWRQPRHEVVLPA